MNKLIATKNVLESIRISGKDGDRPLCARVLTVDDEKAYGALRHTFFVNELQWVEENPRNPGIELDRFDPFSTHLGVWCGDELVAYMRLLPSDTPVNWMLDTDFRVVMEDSTYVGLMRDNAVEISRLVVAKPKGGPVESAEMAVAYMRLLFKLFYHVCLAAKWDRYYVVVQPVWIRAVKKHFPWFGFEPITKAYKFPDGTSALVATTELTTLEHLSASLQPAEHAWFSKV
jgi:N-acyl-L-homoserine lactone synthetase